MGKAVLAFSMSLDGFIAGPDVSDAEPMGRGGERLHDWMFKDHPDRAKDDAVVKQMFADTGAVVLGKRTFDIGVGQWNDTPYPVPSFVLTHERREPLPMTSASFTFVKDGVESALAQARAAAGDRDAVVMGARRCAAGPKGRPGRRVVRDAGARAAVRRHTAFRQHRRAADRAHSDQAGRLVGCGAFLVQCGPDAEE